MSLILKSNQAATKSLGNINGIKGKQDWLLFSDFENQQYTKKVNGVRTDLVLSDVVTCNSAHNLATKPQTIDKFGNVSTITKQNQLRTWLESNRFGVLVEAPRQNHFPLSSAPVSRTLTIAATAPIVISVEGTGSLTVSGNEIATKVITENTPAVIVPTVSTGNINIVCTVAGSLTHAQVERVSGTTCKTSKITSTHTGNSGSTNREADVVILNSNLLSEIVANSASAITVVVQTVRLGLLAEARASTPESSLLLRDNAGHKTFLNINRANSGDFSTRVGNYDNANAVMNLTSGILASNDNVLTQAIKIENGKTYAGLNGTSLLESATQTTENLDLIQLLPSSTAPIVQGGYAIITKLAIFGYALTNEEIKKVSESWK